MIEFNGLPIRGVVLGRKRDQQIVLRDTETRQVIAVITVARVEGGKAHLHCSGAGVNFVRAELESSGRIGGS